MSFLLLLFLVLLIVILFKVQVEVDLVQVLHGLLPPLWTQGHLLIGEETVIKKLLDGFTLHPSYRAR